MKLESSELQPLAGALEDDLAVVLDGECSEAIPAGCRGVGVGTVTVPGRSGEGGETGLLVGGDDDVSQVGQHT